jgi:hypothetical protein
VLTRVDVVAVALSDLFNLKFTAKQLVRESKKCEQNAAANKLKCKKAMESNNMEGARIYAETAIRDKNQALNCTHHAHTPHRRQHTPHPLPHCH